MKKVMSAILAAMVAGLLIFGAALAQQGGTGSSSGGAAGGPGYGPGTVPDMPATNVPVPAGADAGAAGPGAEAGATPAEGEGGLTGSEGGGGEGGGGVATYVEMRKDETVFKAVCLKCHPKEKILSRRRTEADWKNIVLNKHLMVGRINISDAAPVLRYLNTYYGPNPPPKTPAPLTAPGKLPAAPQAPGTPAQPAGATPPPAQPAPPIPAPPTPAPSPPEKP